MTLGGGTDVGGRRAGEGDGEGEGVWLSVASMWFCSVGEGVGVETGVSTSCWGESKPESPEARFCITYSMYVYGMKVCAKAQLKQSIVVLIIIVWYIT